MSWFHHGMLDEFHKIELETHDFQRWVMQYQQQGQHRILVSRDEFNRRILALCEVIISHLKSGEAIEKRAVFDLSKVQDLTFDEVKRQTGMMRQLLSQTFEEDIRQLLFNLLALQRQLVRWEQELLMVIEQAKTDYYDINNPALAQPFIYESSPSGIVLTLQKIVTLAKKLDLDMADILPKRPSHYFISKVDHYERKLKGLLGMAA